jgi:hypothetical protein
VSRAPLCRPSRPACSTSGRKPVFSALKNLHARAEERRKQEQNGDFKRKLLSQNFKDPNEI